MQFSQSQITAATTQPAQIDQLATIANPTSAAVQFFVTALNTYNSIVVVVLNPSGKIPAIGWFAEVTNSTIGVNATWSGAFSGQPVTAALALPQYQVEIGCINNINDIMFVTVVFNAVPPTGTEIAVYGLTGPPKQAIRGDGRNYPVGAFNGYQALLASNGPSTVIAAIPGVRFLLKSMQIGQETVGNVLQQVNVTIGGTTNFLVQNVGGPINQTLGWDSGVLLDPDTPVTLSGGGTPTGSTSILYDIVPE